MSPFLIGLIEVAVLAIVFFVLGAARWIESSRPDECVAENSCYCEPLGTGMIKQPSNTVSNLGFVIVGIALLASLPAAVAGSGADPMEEETVFSVLYGCVVIFLGPGSMFFHASMKKWGGWVDTFSMMLFTGFLLVYDIVGVADGGKGMFFGIYLPLVAVLGALSWFVPRSPIPGFSMGSFSFGAMAGGWILLQFFTIAGIPDTGIDRANGPAILLLLAAAFVFGVAFVIQQKSQTGKPWCQPEATIQGHALWHVLAAAATVILFFYLQTEVGPR